MTSYRGVEAIDCVGMQPAVEPDLGLCDNLKPNRLFGAERKRFYRALRLQGSLLYQENHAIVAWFRESFSGVFRNKNS